jgi:hypothetical protein
LLVFSVEAFKRLPVHTLFLSPSFTALIELEDALAEFMFTGDDPVELALILGSVRQLVAVAAQKQRPIRAQYRNAAITLRAQKPQPLSTIMTGGAIKGYFLLNRPPVALRPETIPKMELQII